MSDPAALQVIILRDGLLVGTEAFVPGTFLVGSSAESDLKLEDPTIAGQHAILFFQNGRAAIQQSQGAVLVNGHAVRACEVRPVDEIAIGPFTLKLRMLAKRAQVPKPAPAAELAQVLGNGAPAQQRPAPQPAAPNGAARIPAHPAPAAAPNAGIPSVAPVSAPAPSVSPVTAPPPNILAQTTVGRRPNGTPPPSAAQLAPALEPRAIAQQPVARPALQPQPARVPAQPQPGARVPAQPAARAPAAQVARPAPQAPAPRSAAAAHSSTMVFGQGAAAPQIARPAPIEPEIALGEAEQEDRTETGITAAVARPAPVDPVTVPSARRVGNAVVEDRPAPRRADSLPELQIDSGPFHALSSNERPAAKPFRVPTQGRRGTPRLYLELFWGDAQQASHCKPIAKPVEVGAHPRNHVALWGFAAPEGFVLADPAEKGVRLHAPPGSRVERLRKDGSFGPAPGSEVALNVGDAAQLVSGKMRLRAYVAPPPERFFGNPFKDVPWLALFFLVLTCGAISAFIIKAPKDADLPDFNAQDLAPVAVRLLKPQKPKPEKKKPEKAVAEKDKPKEEKPKVAEEKPKPRPIARATPKPEPKVEQPPAPEVKALKALEKLSAAGPAMHDMLAAVDKLGNGPGAKNAKVVNYKLSGLVGKAPIASAGLGSFGLGGGGKGGIGTLGAELLHGKGAGGIGAMGAGGVGHGKIGGTVAHAVARNISASGNIDREAVARTVNQHLQEVRACYERQLLKDPGLAGKVVLEWTISTAGRVVQARTKTSSLNNATVESCILASLKNWQFPQAHGGLVIVSYPFLFNAVGY